MKRYIKSIENTDLPDVQAVWRAIPKEYHPYIDEITIIPQHSVYRNQDVITYNAFFKNFVWEGDKNPVVGILYAEDIPTLISELTDHLMKKFPELRNKIMNRWHPKRNNW